jgi:hypothetical protein
LLINGLVVGGDEDPELAAAIKASLKEANFSGTALSGLPIKSPPKSAEISPRSNSKNQNPKSSNSEEKTVPLPLWHLSFFIRLIRPFLSL